MASVFNPSITIKDLTLENIEVHLARNEEGTLSTGLLLPAPVSDSPRTPEEETDKVVGEAIQKELEQAFRVVLERLAVTHLSFRYTDGSIQKDPMETTVADINLLISNLSPFEGRGRRDAGLSFDPGSPHPPTRGFRQGIPPFSAGAERHV
jgi:hypothetical protein